MVTSVTMTRDDELADLAVRALHNPQLDYEPSRYTMKREHGVAKWATNCNWIDDYQYADDARNDMYLHARGTTIVDYSIGGKHVSLKDAIVQHDLFDLEDYWACSRIQAGAEKNSPRRWIYRREAIGDVYKSIQINPKKHYRFLAVDIDRADARELALGNPNMPTPSFFVFDPQRNTGHAVFAIKNPVPHGDEWIKSKPFRYWTYVRSLVIKALKGDPNYTGHFIKNPYHSDFVTAWGTKENIFTLSELENCALAAIEAENDLHADKSEVVEDSEQVRERRAKQRKNSIALADQQEGRNTTIFNTVRFWAYRFRHRYTSLMEWTDAVLARCKEVNKELARGIFQDRGDLPEREIIATARSIARWTWNNKSMSEQGRFTDKQRAKSVKTRKTRTFNKILPLVREAVNARTNSTRGNITGRRKGMKIDRKNFIITLPKGMTFRELRTFYRQAHGTRIEPYFYSYLREDLSDLSLLRPIDRERIESGLRQLGDLSVDEQLIILREVMNSPAETYAEMEQAHMLQPDVIKRLVHKYRTYPWTLAGAKETPDDVTAQALVDEAKLRWKESVRNGGDVTEPFEMEDEADALELLDDIDEHDDAVVLTDEEREDFERIAQSIINDDAEREYGLFSKIRLFARGLSVERVAQGDFSLTRRIPGRIEIQAAGKMRETQAEIPEDHSWVTGTPAGEEARYDSIRENVESHLRWLSR